MSILEYLDNLLVLKQSAGGLAVNVEKTVQTLQSFLSLHKSLLDLSHHLEYLDLVLNTALKHVVFSQVKHWSLRSKISVLASSLSSLKGSVLYGGFLKDHV